MRILPGCDSPVLDLLRDLLRLEEGDSVESLLEKVQREIRAIGDDLAWTAPLGWAGSIAASASARRLRSTARSR